MSALILTWAFSCGAKKCRNREEEDEDYEYEVKQRRFIEKPF